MKRVVEITSEYSEKSYLRIYEGRDRCEIRHKAQRDYAYISPIAPSTILPGVHVLTQEESLAWVMSSMQKTLDKIEQSMYPKLSLLHMEVLCKDFLDIVKH